MDWKCCNHDDIRTLRQRLIDPRINYIHKITSTYYKDNKCTWTEGVHFTEICISETRTNFVEYFFEEVCDQSEQISQFESYQIKKQKIYNEKLFSQNYIIKRIKNKQLYLTIPEYTVTAKILRKQNLCIPVVVLQSNNHSRHTPKLTLIYSHGNSSDLLDAFDFFSKYVKLQQVNVVIYDFTGYGISDIKQTTQQTICQDLDLIIDWLTVPKEEIVLWGFSLGTYPTVNIAAKHKVGGVILQSPLASASFFIQNQEQRKEQIQENRNSNKKSPYKYSMDSLDNLKHIGEIQSPIIIFHSSSDQIIPISHSRKLYNIIRMENKSETYMLIQVSKLSHNQMHYYFCWETDNPLKSILNQFMGKTKHNVLNKINRQKKQKSYEKSNPMIPSFHSLKDQHSFEWSNIQVGVPMVPKHISKTGKGLGKVQKSCPNINKSYLQSPKSKEKSSDNNKMFISFQSNMVAFGQDQNYQNDDLQWKVQDQQQIQSITKVINQNNKSNSSISSKKTYEYFNLCTKNHKRYFNEQIPSSNSTSINTKNNQMKFNCSSINMNKEKKIIIGSSFSKKL